MAEVTEQLGGSLLPILWPSLPSVFTCTTGPDNSQQWRECLFSYRLQLLSCHSTHMLWTKTSATGTSKMDVKAVTDEKNTLSWALLCAALTPNPMALSAHAKTAEPECAKSQHFRQVPGILSDFGWHCEEKVSEYLWVWFSSKNRHVGTLEGTGSQIHVFEVSTLSVHMVWNITAKRRKPITNMRGRRNLVLTWQMVGTLRGCKAFSSCTVQVSQSLMTATEVGMPSPAMIIQIGILESSEIWCEPWNLPQLLPTDRLLLTFPQDVRPRIVWILIKWGFTVEHCAHTPSVIETFQNKLNCPQWRHASVRHFWAIVDLVIKCVHVGLLRSLGTQVKGREGSTLRELYKHKWGTSAQQRAVSREYQEQELFPSLWHPSSG